MRKQPFPVFWSFFWRNAVYTAIAVLSSLLIGGLLGDQLFEFIALVLLCFAATYFAFEHALAKHGLVDPS